MSIPRSILQTLGRCTVSSLDSTRHSSIVFRTSRPQCTRSFSKCQTTGFAVESSGHQPASRTPRPVPLDIGSTSPTPLPNTSFFSPRSSRATASTTTTTTTVAAAAESVSATAASTSAPRAGGIRAAAQRFKDRPKSYGFFYKFGTPLFTTVVYATATSLLLHLLYQYLTLEEYTLESTERLQRLEAEIKSLKEQNLVRHANGGRGEFV